MMNIKLFSGVVVFGAVLLTAVVLHKETVPAEQANAMPESVPSVTVNSSETRKMPLSEGRPLRLTISLLGNSHEELYQKMAELRADIFAKRDSLGSEKTIPIERESIRITQASEGEGLFRARQRFVVNAHPKQAEALSTAISGIPDVEIEPAIDRSVDISGSAFEEAVNSVCRNALSKAAEYTSTAGKDLDTGRVLYARGNLEYFVSGANEATVSTSLFLQKELFSKSARHSFSDSRNLAKLEILSHETEKFAADEFKTFFQLELQGADKKALYQQAVKRNAEILRQLRELGVSDADVSTGQISLTKNFRYNYQSGKNEFLGYRANQFFEVTTRSKDSAGAVVKTFASSNDLQNNGTEPITQRTAHGKAIESAKEKAELFAEGLGRRLGNVLFIEDSSEPTARMYSRAAKASGAVDLSNGYGNAADAIADSVEVSATARLVFELK